MKSSNGRVLGLFPYFGPEILGGVQASARIAWDAITENTEESATLLSYVGGNGANSVTSGSGNSADLAETVLVSSKTNALYKALSRNWPHDLVFIWHLGLLRLLPFFRLSQARVVMMLLGVEAWREQSWLTRKQLEKVDLFLSISDHTWRRFVDFNPQYEAKPHQTVLLGIGTARENTTPPPRSTPAALMLSRLSKGEDYKGHREVIDAWPTVIKQMSNAELWIAGDGDLRNDLEKLVTERGLETNVRFWGQVDEEKKQQLLQESRCLVMPSRGEGFGLVYLEAMRLGRPCLVSTLDAGLEVVNPPEAGLAVNPDDGQEIAVALCRLMTAGPEWQRWSEQARRRYEDNYTAEHFQERLLAALFSEKSVDDLETGSKLSAVSHV
jgi:phosphatidylinositol alpha-1,6-mannosyltransferase